MPRRTRSSWLRMSDLLAQLGGIPPERVRLQPVPGQATERDLLHILDHEDCLSELIDGVIVDKPLWFPDAVLGAELTYRLGMHVHTHELGVLTGASGPFRLAPGQVRLPDVAFISTARLPGGRVPADPIANFVPDLAIEIVSSTNTTGEMKRKRSDYFKAGVRQVWMIDLQKRTADLYASTLESLHIQETDSIIGGAVLPGFCLPLAELFAKFEPRIPPRRKRSPKTSS